MRDDQGWSLFEQIPLVNDLLQPSVRTILSMYAELVVSPGHIVARRFLDQLCIVASWSRCSLPDLVHHEAIQAHRFRRAKLHGGSAAA